MRPRPAQCTAHTTAGTIEYLVAGSGPALLAFHGALGNAESMEWFVHAFAPYFRVIVPSLGDTGDVVAFCDRVDALLTHEGIHAATIFGISFGGLLAQSFVRRHPARVERMILMSCGAPRRASAAIYIAARMFVRTLPLRAMRSLTSLFLSRRLVHAPVTKRAVRRALVAHRRRLARIAECIGRDLVLARFRIATDVHRDEHDIRSALDSWQGRTLLLLANDDPLFSQRALERARSAFPRAHVHTFAEGGHLIPLFNAEEMRRIVVGFAGAE